MLVHVFAKQAPTSGPLLLLCPLMLMDLNFLPIPLLLYRGIGIQNVFLALNANLPEIP